MAPNSWTLLCRAAATCFLRHKEHGGLCLTKYFIGRPDVGTTQIPPEELCAELLSLAYYTQKKYVKHAMSWCSLIFENLIFHPSPSLCAQEDEHGCSPEACGWLSSRLGSDTSKLALLLRVRVV